ncbi:uncharacterized protein LOC141882542 isoform X2 [Acropora palmata]|uniref:uncharacterized protein LOC141882542 isoform X2 n=1 Tax=Acropora palmata TaxID=6131 RepID=UPI003DA06302
MEFAVLRAIFVINAFLKLVGARPGGMGGIGGSKPGICPPIPDAECPEEIENYCTQGDDNTCGDDLKCCYTGCEYDCLVPDVAPDPPARKHCYMVLGSVL